METRLSRCYYHSGKAAVATCAQCGAGVCRECAVKNNVGRIICYQCGNSNLKQEHKNYRDILKKQGGRFRNGKEFIVPAIIGILIVVAMGMLMYFSGKFTNELNNLMNKEIETIIALFLMAYMFFSTPFGVIKLNDMFAPKYDTAYHIFSKWYFKIAASVFVGWIFFTFYLIRFIVIKIKSKKEHKE